MRNHDNKNNKSLSRKRITITRGPARYPNVNARIGQCYRNSNHRFTALATADMEIITGNIFSSHGLLNLVDTFGGITHENMHYSIA